MNTSSNTITRVILSTVPIREPRTFFQRPVQNTTGLCNGWHSTPTISAGGSTNVTVTLLPSSQLLSGLSNNTKPSNLIPFNILGIAVVGLVVLRGSKVKATPTLLVVLIMLGFSLSCGGRGKWRPDNPTAPTAPVVRGDDRSSCWNLFEGAWRDRLDSRLIG